MVKALAMTHTDNTSFLAQANARRHQAALSAARHAIDQLQRQGKPVNFSAIAQTAGVSRGWLYRQDQIRDIIGRLRRLDPPAARITAQRASAESLRQRLDWTPTGFVDTIRSGTMVYEERTGSGTGSQEVHPGI